MQTFNLQINVFTEIKLFGLIFMQFMLDNAAFLLVFERAAIVSGTKLIQYSTSRGSNMPDSRFHSRKFYFSRLSSEKN